MYTIFSLSLLLVYCTIEMGRENKQKKNQMVQFTLFLRGYYIIQIEMVETHERNIQNKAFSTDFPKERKKKCKLVREGEQTQVGAVAVCSLITLFFYHAFSETTLLSYLVIQLRWLSSQEKGLVQSATKDNKEP